MIEVSNLWHTFLKRQNFLELEKRGLAFCSQGKKFPSESTGFFVSWGDFIPSTRHCIAETGFFRNGMHMDSNGLYESSSFNLSGARKIISEFSAPKSWRQLNNEKKILSKFPQPTATENWDGIVVACQYPKDRSILRAGSIRNYYDFLEESCKYYGGKAFLKIHPVITNNKEERSIIESCALKYGCEVGHVGSSILDNAEAVVVYNSTYVVDALLRGKKVLQYAPGYFWQSGVVQYLSRSCSSPDENEDKEYIDKFLDFLIWKYCFHMDSPIENIANIIREFSTSKSLFPLPQEFSYGAFIEK